MSNLLSPKELKELVAGIMDVEPDEEAIWMHIENIVDKYEEDNYNLLYQLLNLLNQYDDFDCYSEAARYDPPNEFIDKISAPTLEDYKTAENPIARFAKVYIQYMTGDYGNIDANNISYQEEVIAGVEHGFYSSHTFNSILTKENLIELHDWLVSEKIIEVDKRETFIKIFSNVHRSQVESKIKWLLMKNGGNHNYSLFLLLSLIAPDELTYLPSIGDYHKKISYFFESRTPKFKYNTIRKSHYEWLNEYKSSNHIDDLDTVSTQILGFINTLQK